jgi:hypothetical protein
VIVEIPDTGFAEVWNDIFFRAILRQMRSEGLSVTLPSRPPMSTSPTGGNLEISE